MAAAATRQRRRLALGIACALLSGCAAASAETGTAAATPTTARLTVVTAIVLTTGPLGTEGVVPEVVVKDSLGRVVATQDGTDATLTDRFTFDALPRAHYIVSVGLRTCDANCGNLDPGASLGCHETVDLTTGDSVVAVRWLGGTPCTWDEPSPAASVSQSPS